MTEAFITEGRILVGAGVRTDEGYTQQDPTAVLDDLRKAEAGLRNKVLNSGDPDIDGARQWFAVRADLLVLEGRPQVASSVLKMGADSMIRTFGPRAIVGQTYAVLSGEK